MGSYLILKALLGSGGRWQEVWQALALHETLLRLLLEEANLILSPSVATLLQSSTFFFPYLRDQPARNRYWHNQIAQLCQACHQSQAPNFSEQHQQRHAIAKSANASRKLRVGYISHCLKQHSVGWLSRWLFQYHQQQDFEWSLYLISHETDPFSAQWFASRVNMVRTYEMPDPVVVAQDIFDDQIDILVDLDSLTVDRTMSTLALKPAPIQVTWLGWDASGLPAIDYFIADPYVLPDNAQDYYQESIWRLPQTYVAVDGFEVSVPTLRRDQLDIPTDAIIYLTAQRGYKRHPDTVRLQLQILKDVPNSYLLVKGIADDAAIQDFFNQLADDVGVDPGRLRFLERDPSEPVHRANLQIADVVLDTYPYNGATTTLETLWMGIPLVTRVGEQFSARNSYTFMINAGITEGIAWTDEEYVEWGVRLGKDEALRQLIHWKLKASRQTSPLWNAKQFTHNMEQAYQQMWAKYCELIIPAQVYSDPK
jgi:predicted O-linked N-acetylglucosamine transferase (SPINDLY family)